VGARDDLAEVDTRVTSLPLIYVVNSNLDTLDLLQVFFEQNGFAMAGCLASAIRRQDIDLRSECEQLRPIALIYDVGPPYDREWQFLRELLQSGICSDIPLIVTTTNEERLRRSVGTDEPILELFTKPYDMRLLIEAVTRALRNRRPSSQLESGR
jgi:DNA-binding response OmpR family regulator